MLLVSVQVGKPEQLAGEPAGGATGKPWRTGYRKSAIAGPVFCGRLHLEGDGQANHRWHGGPEMAVLAYSSDHYPRWRAELGWEDAGPGTFAENLTVAGAAEESVCIGDVWAAGGARLQVSEPRKPCSNISRFHRRPDLLKLVIESGRFGWYLRVLEEGSLQAGDEIRLVDRPHPEWTVAQAMRVRLGRAEDPGAAAALAALPVLGSDWREFLLPK